MGVRSFLKRLLGERSDTRSQVAETSDHDPRPARRAEVGHVPRSVRRSYARTRQVEAEARFAEMRAEREERLREQYDDEEFAEHVHFINGEESYCFNCREEGVPTADGMCIDCHPQIER